MFNHWHTKPTRPIVYEVARDPAMPSGTRCFWDGVNWADQETGKRSTYQFWYWREV